MRKGRGLVAIELLSLFVVHLSSVSLLSVHVITFTLFYNLQNQYSLTSPYRHLYNKDTCKVDNNCPIIVSVPLVSVLKRFNNCPIIVSVPLVSVLKRFDCSY